MATHSWLPIVQAFIRAVGVEVVTADISLAARIIASFPEFLTSRQRVPDALKELGELVQKPWANIIKLPNISASLPQLQAAIRELQGQGYPIPDYPGESSMGRNTSHKNPAPVSEQEVHARYHRVLGSAVNPVLREGNSDRRVASAVKQYAQKHPHRMGPWSGDSKSHVASMEEGDFYSSECSAVMERGGEVSIEWIGDEGQQTALREKISLMPGEVIDASVMSCQALRDYFQREMGQAKGQGVLLSLHLKATMMKVSDPIIFGHGVEVFYQQVFSKYRQQLAQLGVNSRNGTGELDDKLEQLPVAQREDIRRAMARAEEERAPLAMVDSDRGISNLYTPNNIIIDASMPAAIRNSGQMWGPDGRPADIKALIPDRCYGGIYQEVMDDCRRHGAFDVSSMGNVCNVGLMAQKAQEYGSHDKTFELSGSGVVRVVNCNSQKILFEHRVAKGDIWRMCQTRDQAIRDWVKLGVSRARATGGPAIFWLDPQRAHDANLIKLVQCYLKDHDTNGLEISIMSPVEAMRHTLKQMRQGQDTISVTGNVLRDYLTDLFPILELGTSAKMLSIVPLLGGGGLYETGAGGSAPKHVQQFVQENHLRWDSLGEFLALAVSLEDLASRIQNELVRDLARALHLANGHLLQMNKSPSRKVGELDTRGGHFYLALYWAKFLGEKAKDAKLRQRFSSLYGKLHENEATIVEELQKVQGRAVDIVGHYHPDLEKVARAMRPSKLLNSMIESF